MTIDWSLNLGHILTIAGFVIGGLLFVVAIRADVNSIRMQEGNIVGRVDAVERELRAMRDVLVSLARQDERLNSHAHRLDKIDDRLGALETERA